jgi:two-component system NarL family sensor kinase
MSLKVKLLLLAILPLLLVTAVVTWISVRQAEQLLNDEIRIFEASLLANKTTEMQHYVSLALTSISHVLENAEADDLEAQEQVKRILSSLTCGADGYFYVYDRHGKVLVHPILTHLIGRDLMDYQDPNGDYVIRHLWRVAREGGGVHRYMWNKPSLGEEEHKLGYAVMLPQFEWMLGTGIYLDDMVGEVARMREQFDTNIRRTFLSILVIVSATVVLIVATGLVINVHESRLADQRLRQLAHRSVQLQLNERRRFARELHDGINQMMASAKFRVELAEEQVGASAPAVGENLKLASRVLGDVIREVRRISHDLRPSLLDDLGLGPALGGLLSEFEERTGVEFDLELDLPERRPTEDVEITLYRVVQEALTNVERHARARRVKLRTWVSGDRLWLELEDDGVGFRLGQTRGGIGLRNMRERVEVLSGEFHLQSEPGHGTRIRAVLSLLA